MITKTMTNAFAGLLLVSSAPAFAQLGVGLGGSGGGGVSVGGIGVGVGGGVGGGLGNVGAGVGANAGAGTNVGVQTRDATRINSQGNVNASANGGGHANHNSVHGGVAGGAGVAVTSGMTVMSTAGAQIGTVSKVVTNAHGVITRVMVKANGGGTVSLSPKSLSVAADGSLVTNARVRGQ